MTTSPALTWHNVAFRITEATSKFATYRIEGEGRPSKAHRWWLTVKPDRFERRGPYETQAQARAAAEIIDVGLADRPVAAQ